MNEQKDLNFDVPKEGLDVLSDKFVLPEWFQYMTEEEWDTWMIQQKLPDNMEELQVWLDSLESPYDVAEWMHQMKHDDSEKVYVQSELYCKIDCTTENQRNVSYTVDENGALHCWNISAYQIPSISLTEEISGTVYTVTGSFEGSQNMLRKLERITAQNFSAEMGEDA